MSSSRSRVLRTRLVLELAEADRLALADWLSRELESGALKATAAADMGVVLAGAIGAPDVKTGATPDGFKQLEQGPISIRLGSGPLLLPSRRRPRMVILPARCFGLSEGLVGMIDRMVPGSGGRPGGIHARRGYIPAGRAVGAIESARETPRRLPGSLPRELRGPIEAVRLGLYCSRTTPKGRDSVLLARVELPAAAAVR